MAAAPHAGFGNTIVRIATLGSMAVADDLVWYLVWRSSEEEAALAKTRLVKFVYLVDLETARSSGESITGFRWRYWHYGPYAAEIETVLAEAEGQTVIRSTGTSYHGDRFIAYRPLEQPPPNILPFRVKVACDRVIEKWALADLDELLNFVYFETPPMQDVRRGQYLDLLAYRERPWPRRYFPLGAPDISDDLKNRFVARRRLQDDYAPARPRRPRRDDPDYSAVHEQHDADMPERPLRGRLRFTSPTDLEH